MSDSLSEASLDSQYDMIDDISEISTDGDETASLVSTEREDGQLTPEESVVDLHEERGDGHATPESELLHSYMSDELETPRQSIVQGELQRNAIPASFDNTRRVLFISEGRVENNVISDICLRITSCLVSPEEALEGSISRRVVLSRGSSLTHALFLRVGREELLVESYSMGKPISPNTHLAVFYLATPTVYPAYYNEIKTTLHAEGVPSMTVGSPDFDFNALDDEKTLHATDSDIVVTDSQLFSEDDENLRAQFQNLLLKREPEPKSSLHNLWEMCPLDGLYYDKTKFTWQEFFLRILPLIGIVLALIIKSTNVLETIDGPPPPTRVDVDWRRQALGNALWRLDNSTYAKNLYNIEHLLPYPIESVSSAIPLIPSEIRFQGVPPSDIIISIPKPVDGWFWHHFPVVTSSNVYKSEQNLEFIQTNLIDGVYAITIPAEDAYGVVTVNMTTKSPAINILVEHDFGYRMLCRKTFEKARMDLSKTINKDVIIARRNVESLGEKLNMEWTAGKTATKNVTSELAVYIARDLQILANTAISVFSKAAARGNVTAANIRKELVVMSKELAVIQKDLIKLTKDVQKSVIKTAHSAKGLMPSMETVQYPFKLSKERAGKFRDVIVKRARGKAVKSSCGRPSLKNNKTLRERMQSALKSYDRTGQSSVTSMPPSTSATTVPSAARKLSAAKKEMTAVKEELSAKKKSGSKKAAKKKAKLEAKQRKNTCMG